MTYANKRFGMDVKALRKLKPMTLPELAKKAKISKGLLSKIEHGNGNPTIDTIVKIAKALDTYFLIQAH